jgi:hypothetical protein
LEPRMKEQLPTVLKISLKLPLVTNKLTQNDKFRLRFSPSRLCQPSLQYQFWFVLWPLTGKPLLQGVQCRIARPSGTSTSWDKLLWSLSKLGSKLGDIAGQTGTFWMLPWKNVHENSLLTLDYAIPHAKSGLECLKTHYIPTQVSHIPT